MKNNNAYKRGFTLIELLVVVLIIGILASVALPQYQKAVEKSRQAEAWTMMKSIQDAVKIYEMENDSSGGTINWEDLTLQFTNSEGASITGDIGGSDFQHGVWQYAYRAGWASANRLNSDWYVLIMSPTGQKFCSPTATTCAKVGAKTSVTATCGGDFTTGSCYPF